MKKTLVIDSKFKDRHKIENSISLLPGHNYQPAWTLNFENHSAYNKAIIKAREQLANLFSKEIFSPKLGYEFESCRALFLNFGGLITFVIGDRLLRINKLLATYSIDNLLVPTVIYEHDCNISYNNFFYNVVEQDPNFNQWIINELLPSISRNKIIITKDKDSGLFISEKNNKKISIFNMLARFIRKNILATDINLIKRIKNVKETIRSISERKLKNLIIGLTRNKGSIIMDTPFQSLTSQLPIISFYWPFGPLSFLSTKIPNRTNNDIGKINRKMFAKYQDNIATIFKNMLNECKEEIRVPDESLLNIVHIISDLLPASTTEFAEINCDFILNNLKPNTNKTYFCNGTYHSDVSTLTIFACRELKIKIVAAQHSAWGGYLANGPLVSELLIKGCDDYISFGWHEKPNDGTSSWKNDIIPMPSPVLSQIKLKKKKQDLSINQHPKRHVFLCLGFLYRFPSIYNSFLRWDTVNEWSSIINDMIEKLSRSQVKITFIMYNDYVAETLQEFVGQWLQTGGDNIIEYSNHNSDVRGILSKDDFKDQYDAVIWDLPAGGFTESLANGLTTFSLWNDGIIKSLPEGDPFINDLLKSGVFFKDGNALLNSLERLYRDPEWYQSDSTQVPIYAFTNRFALHYSDWKIKWKKLFNSYSRKEQYNLV
jgi:hypothetical protein